MLRPFTISALCLIMSLVSAVYACAETPAWLRSDSATVVSLLTCAPGSIIYELEGHAALRVRQSDGSDVTVNWGLFDFNKPNFVYRFVKGDTDYKAGACPTGYFLQEYISSGRRVTEFVLNLDDDQKKSLLDAVAFNIMPENAEYRYNYVRQNCSTAILDHIENAVGTGLIMPDIPENLTDATSFRKAMSHYHKNYPWYQFGIDLALGNTLDLPINARELAFAPAALAEMAPGITAGGKRIFDDPIEITPGSISGTALPPTPWWRTPLAVGILVALAALAFSVADIRRHRISRGFDSLFYAAIGLTGCVITYLVFISSHYASSPNWLLLWINPFSLFIAACIWWRATYPLLRIIQMVNIAAIATYLLLNAAGVVRTNQALYPFIFADAARAISFIIISRNVITKKTE